MNQSLWLDEAINVRHAANLNLVDLITHYSLGDFHPPAFHPLLHFWINLFGDSEFSVRTPSLVFGLITIIFTYLISLHLLPAKKITLFHLSLNLQHFPTILLATSGLHLYYSTEARMYSMAAAFVSASFYFFFRLISQHKLKPIWKQPQITRQLHFSPTHLCFIIAASLALYTDYLTWFLLPLFFSYLPLPTIISLLTTLPWWPFLAKQLNLGLATASTHPLWNQVVGQFSLKNLLLVPVKFLIGRVAIDNNLLYFLVLITPLFLVAFLFITFIRHHLSQPSTASTLIASWFFLPLTLGVVISLKIPIFSYFRFLFILPAFYLILTWGLARLQTQSKITILILLTTNLISSSAFIFLPQFHREDWRSLSAWIDSYPTNSAVAIFPNLAQADPYLYYQQRVPALNSIREVDSLPEVVFLLRYVQDIFDPTDSKRQDIQALGYQLIETRNFNGVVVWAYLLQEKVLAVFNL